MAEFHFRTWVSWCQYKSVRFELAFLHTTGVLWLKREEEIPVTQNQITTNALCGAVYNYTECGMSSILKFSFWIPVWHSFGNCFFTIVLLSLILNLRKSLVLIQQFIRQPTLFHTHHSLCSAFITESAITCSLCSYYLASNSGD